MEGGGEEGVPPKACRRRSRGSNRRARRPSVSRERRSPRTASDGSMTPTCGAAGAGAASQHTGASTTAATAFFCADCSGNTQAFESRGKNVQLRVCDPCGAQLAEPARKRDPPGANTALQPELEPQLRQLEHTQATEPDATAGYGFSSRTSTGTSAGVLRMSSGSGPAPESTVQILTTSELQNAVFISYSRQYHREVAAVEAPRRRLAVQPSLLLRQTRAVDGQGADGGERRR